MTLRRPKPFVLTPISASTGPMARSLSTEPAPLVAHDQSTSPSSTRRKLTRCSVVTCAIGAGYGGPFHALYARYACEQIFKGRAFFRQSTDPISVIVLALRALIIRQNLVYAMSAQLLRQAPIRLGDTRRRAPQRMGPEPGWARVRAATTSVRGLVDGIQRA